MVMRVGVVWARPLAGLRGAEVVGLGRARWRLPGVGRVPAPLVPLLHLPLVRILKLG